MLVDKIITFSAFALVTTSSEIVVFPVMITQATFKSMHLINADWSIADDYYIASFDAFCNFFHARRS